HARPLAPVDWLAVFADGFIFPLDGRLLISLTFADKSRALAVDTVPTGMPRSPTNGSLTTP
ncbi:MAG: hypothetical protein ACJ8HI_16060, partial [Massilia sp.]